MSEPAGARPDRPGHEHDSIVVLDGATWADFQRMLEIRGERGAPRFAFVEGRLEIMSPSRSHESIKSMIGRLVETWCDEHDVLITAYGSWTLEDEAAERGAEPDECYVIGSEPNPDRPDLAIEVVWTSGRIDKLEIYRRLGVREVWYWRHGKLDLFGLRGDRYEAIGASEVLAGIDHAELLRFMDMRPMTTAVREYRRTLRGGTP
jgi:Uma2 family endonuclease